MTTHDSNRRRILIVEDEPTIGQVCDRVLAAEGFEVDIVPDGVAAQGMIQSKPYGIYLVDIRTPAMDGKELFHWLEEKSPRMARRVIFTTGDVIGRDLQSFLEQTGCLFLPKPFTPEELKAIVNKALSRSIQ